MLQNFLHPVNDGTQKLNYNGYTEVILKIPPFTLLFVDILFCECLFCPKTQNMRQMHIIKYLYSVIKNFLDTQNHCF